MAGRARLMALAVCLALLLGGCASLPFQNVNDLLRAPTLGSGQGDIQKALEAYLDGNRPQYKYPKEGEWRSPLIRADLDGDGVAEAVLLYSLDSNTPLGQEKGDFVYVAVLQNTDGVWRVVYDEKGLLSDVASLEVADLLGGNTRQLIVGYASANLTTRTFALYTWQNGALARLYEYNYSKYLIGDFTGRGGNDLVVVSDLGNLQLHYIPTRDGCFLLDEPAEPVKLDVNFQSCAGIAPGVGADGGQLLVVDGVNATNSGALTSQMVYYGNGRFYTIDDAGYMRGITARLNPLLKSRDIDGDGVVEIPRRWGRNPIATLSGEKNLEYVEWWDFTSQSQPFVKQFGILDGDRSVFIRLPEGWRGQVEVLDGPTKSEWHLQSRRTLGVVLQVQTMDSGETPPLGAVRVPGGTGVYLVVRLGLTEAERDMIAMTQLA